MTTGSPAFEALEDLDQAVLVGAGLHRARPRSAAGRSRSSRPARRPRLVTQLQHRGARDGDGWPLPRRTAAVTNISGFSLRSGFSTRAAQVGGAGRRDRARRSRSPPCRGRSRRDRPPSLMSTLSPALHLAELRFVEVGEHPDLVDVADGEELVGDVGRGEHALDLDARVHVAAHHLAVDRRRARGTAG